MTIELSGLNMLVDDNGNPIVHVGDVLAIYARLQPGDTYDQAQWTKPWIVTKLLVSAAFGRDNQHVGFKAKQPFQDDATAAQFIFGHVAIKLLARAGESETADGT